MVKKGKKQIKQLGETAMMGAGMGMALGGIGGASAVHGQEGIARATGYLPMAGRVMGAGMLVRAIGKLDPYKKKKRR